MADMNKQQQDVFDGLMENLARAAELGLIPQKGASISKKGEFIVNPSTLEEAEDKKMRGYRYKAFPKHVHGWNAAGEPVSKEVADQHAFDAALADGWYADNDPKNAPKSAPKEASVVTHEVVDQRTGRTAVKVSHPEDVKPEKPVKAVPKAGRPRGNRAPKK